MAESTRSSQDTRKRQNVGVPVPVRRKKRACNVSPNYVRHLLTANDEAICDHDLGVPALSLRPEPLHLDGRALGKIEDEQEEDGEGVQAGDAQHENAVDRTRLKGLKEKDDDGELGDGKREDARDDGENGVEEDTAVLVVGKGADAPLAADANGYGHEGEVEEAEDLETKTFGFSL